MARGFHLPQGEIEAGRQAFADLKCTMCHSVAGVEIAGAQAAGGVVLGGEVRKIRTYGELVTAVINPQHSIAPQYAAAQAQAGQEVTASPMPSYNSDMTVKQLSDIVAFLHSRYVLQGPDFPDYPFSP